MVFCPKVVPLGSNSIIEKMSQWTFAQCNGAFAKIVHFQLSTKTDSVFQISSRSKCPTPRLWWCFGKNSRTPSLMVFWRAPSDHWWWWPAVGARAAGAFQSPPLLPTPPISPRWVWTFLDICFCFNIAFSTFLLIYPTQRQNLLRTLEILIKKFENFQIFKILEKNSQNLEFFSKISQTTKGPPMTSKGPPAPY